MRGSKMVRKSEALNWFEINPSTCCVRAMRNKGGKISRWQWEFLLIYHICPTCSLSFDDFVLELLIGRGKKCSVLAANVNIHSSHSW
jgi:hypothetical protein